MSDQMRQQDPQAVEGAVRDNMSAFNPADIAVMIQSGEVTPETPLRDVFQKMGVDVDGPLRQMFKGVHDGIQKAMPGNKMEAISRASPNRMPQGRKPMVPPPQRPGGLEGLI